MYTVRIHMSAVLVRRNNNITPDSDPVLRLASLFVRSLLSTAPCLFVIGPWPIATSLQSTLEGHGKVNMQTSTCVNKL